MDELPLGGSVFERVRNGLVEFTTPRVAAQPESDVLDIVIDASQWRQSSDLIEGLKQSLMTTAGNLSALIDVIVWDGGYLAEEPYRIVVRNIPSVVLRKQAELLAACVAEAREEYFFRRGADRQVSMVVEAPAA